MRLSIRLKPEAAFDGLLAELSGGSLQARLDAAMPGMVKAVAETMQRKVVANIENGRPDWPALSGMTVELKGHRQPLVDSGELLRSIQIQYVGETALVGIPDGMKRSDGAAMDEIAARMEDGTTFEVTEKMRRFFAAKGVSLRAETRFLVVPSRPFFEPAVEETREDLPEILEPFLKGILP